MKKTLVPWGRKVFPSPTARHGERLKRTNWFKCQQCGFRNDGRSTSFSNGPGDGNSKVKPPTKFTNLNQNSTTNPFDWLTQGGCRMCGSLRATRTKPTALPLADTRIPITREQIREETT